MTIEQDRQKVDKLLAKYTVAKTNLITEGKRLNEHEGELTRIEKAQEIAQAVSEMIQKQAHEKLTKVVTTCLQTVFYDENYEFHIRFVSKRNKTEAELYFTKDGHVIEDPMEEDSGGVIDVAAFVLRLSCLMLSKPALRHVVILDEPFKFVSTEYRDNVRTMLETLAEDFDVQFIMVTHIDELVTGKEVRL
jgi:DNA repair exonuclease SbcCD ATPase subunit